jgi:hypothetical protein
MRIPTYRGQAQITTQAPGQSFTARKNPNPFVRQAVAKGNMQAELFSQAASYAATQRKIKVEARKNEAILGAKEAMLQLSDAFLNDNQPYDIFEPDGTGRWDKETKDIKNKLRSKIGTDRYALAAFDTAFAQAELPLRFELKGQIDTKIEKMHVASVNEGWEDFIFKYSDPNVNTTTFDIDFADEADKTNKAVELGAFEKDVMSELPNNVLKRIATDLMPAYAGRDLSKAMDLNKAFDAMQAGTLENAEFKNNIPPHVLNVLGQISPADADQIITATLKSAAAVQKIKRNVDTQNEKLFNDNVKGVYNRYYYYQSANNYVNSFDIKELTSMFPNIKIEGTRVVDDKVMAPGHEMAKAIKNHLAGLNELTFEMRNQMDAFDAEPEKPNTSDRKTIEYLNRLDAFDQLDVIKVLDLTDKLTDTDLIKYTTKAQTEAEAGESEAKQYIRNALRFQTSELISAQVDEDLALRVTNQIDDLYTQIDDAIRNARIAGNPLTKTGIEQKARDLLVSNSGRYKEVVIEQYKDTRDFASKAPEFFRIKDALKQAATPQDAIIILSDWYNNLSNPEADERKRHTQYMRSFTEMANKLDAINDMN